MTKPLHPTQKIDWEGDSLIAKIEVIPNYELETLILSFGEKVEVLEPKELLTRIEDRIIEASKLYDGDKRANEVKNFTQPYTAIKRLK